MLCYKSLVDVTFFPCNNYIVKSTNGEKTMNYVITKKGTLLSLFEVFKQSVVNQINLDKYDVYSMKDYLIKLDKKIKFLKAAA